MCHVYCMRRRGPLKYRVGLYSFIEHPLCTGTYTRAGGACHKGTIPLYPYVTMDVGHYAIVPLIDNICRPTSNTPLKFTMHNHACLCNLILAEWIVWCPPETLASRSLTQQAVAVGVTAGQSIPPLFIRNVIASNNCTKKVSLGYIYSFNIYLYTNPAFNYIPSFIISYLAPQAM